MQKHIGLGGFLALSFISLVLFQNLVVPTVTPLIDDQDFVNGLKVIDPTIEKVYLDPQTRTLGNITCRLYKEVANGSTHNLYFANEAVTTTPKWSIAQWYSKADLFSHHGALVDPSNLGAFEWKNWYKNVILGKYGSGFSGITLGVNGSREYQGIWSDFTDPCVEQPHPHLLISQVPRLVPLGSLRKLEFNFSAKVTKNELHPGFANGWDMEKSTAHFKIHINIQNIRPDRNKTLGHGQSVGLSINVFDVRNRDEDYSESDFLHRPQRRYMLNVASRDLGVKLRGALHAGGWGQVNRLDLLPLIRKAFARSISYSRQQNSYIDELISKNLNDYFITNVNFGWEVSSLHDVEMHVKTFELNAIEN